MVGPGVHFVSNEAGSGVTLRAGTSLLSEAGPTATFLKRGHPPDQPGLIGMQTGCVVSGFSMEGGEASVIGFSDDGVEISNNIIDCGPGGGIGILVNGRASIHNNLCFGGFAGIALALFDSGVQIFNNIILNGVYSLNSNCPLLVWAFCNLINGEQSCFIGYGNFSADPLFCGVGNYNLRADSPCAPGNHPDGFDCGLIGPLPVGCGTVRVRMMTWGAVKALYKD